MQEEKPGLTIEELAERVDVSVRTVRFYIAEGMLAGSGARGKASFYGEEHLLRLMLIRRLAGQGVTLKKIGERLSGLSTDQIRALLAEDHRREEDLRQAEMSPKSYVSSLLNRARLMRETASPERPSEDSLYRPSPTGPTMQDDAGAASQTPAPSPESSPPERAMVGPDGGLPDRRLRMSGEEPPFPSRLPDSQAWQRWELVPGVELHVSNDTAGRYRKLVEQLLRLAKSITG